MLSERFNALSQQLFQKNIEDCPVEELENLAHEYPYFAAAQYILLARLNDTDHNRHQAQLQKSILYYHDPLAFDHFINKEDYSIDFIELAPEEKLIPQASETTIEEISGPNVIESFGGSDEIQLETEIPSGDIETHVEDEKENNETVLDRPVSEVNVEPVVPEPLPQEEKTPVPLLKIEESQPDTGLVFEPYHTVDYFASQGIKLSQEEATRDKFGKQLKSFTEWLKTMKKVPVAAEAKPLDAGSEQKVENLAAHSVEGEEVYTETMAEVWVQQGNKEKAKEVYNKLSLLNPSKRAYFAAKIDSLK